MHRRFEGGGFGSHYVEESFWRRLWTCRQTDYWIIISDRNKVVDLFTSYLASHITSCSLHLRSKLHNKSADRKLRSDDVSIRIKFVTCVRYVRKPQTAEDGLLAKDSCPSFVLPPASYSSCTTRDALTDRIKHRLKVATQGTPYS